MHLAADLAQRERGTGSDPGPFAGTRVIGRANEMPVVGRKGSCYLPRSHSCWRSPSPRLFAYPNNRMKRIAILIVISLCVVPTCGAGMARVVEIIDSHTVLTDEQGVRSSVHLSGVIVPQADESTAADFLRRLTSSGWVLIERDTARRGEAFLFRSPDGLSINGEMIRAAYLQPGTRMIYLGESDPGPRHESRATATPRSTRRAARPARPHHRVRRSRPPATGGPPLITRPAVRRAR